jgi:hypothetical protein
MTDATGKSFLSYRRTRASEAALLIAAQRDHGIPTWQDIQDLSETPTGDELRRVLADRFTANAVLWITPDVKDSAVIRKIEVPCVLKRVHDDDGFFLVPVCAGGINYKAAADAVDEQLTADNLSDWNLPKVNADPITKTDAAEIAKRVLRRRVAAVHRQLESALPLKLTLHTRTSPAFQPGHTLTLDWTPRFAGREALPAAWDDYLLPALSTIANAIRTQGGGRSVVASGLAAIPAVAALGFAFLSQAGQKIAWSQYTHGRPEQLWSLDVPRVSAGFTAKTTERDIAATDLAVLVSVSENVEHAFAQTPKASLPAFRAITRVYHKDHARFDISAAGQAVDIANTVVDAIRAARADYRPLSTVNLFMALPIGLAMLIGQLLNTFGLIQTYEHIPTDATGIYRPAALLRPAL